MSATRKPVSRRKAAHPRGELVEGVLPWIHNRANKLAGTLGDAAYDADDLAQDAALAALERPTGHNPERGAATTWAGLIVKSVAAGKRVSDLRDRRDCRRKRSISDDTANDAFGIAEDDGGDDHDPEALAGILRGVRIALMQLPFEERQAVSLHFGIETDGEGLAPAAIAQRLAVPTHEVNKLLNRGLDKLYALMSAPPPPKMTPNELLMSVHDWIRKLSWRYADRVPVHFTPEDLVQEFAICILRYASLYDPARGARTTFAERCARSAVNQLRRRKRIKTASLDGTADKSLLRGLAAKGGNPAEALESRETKEQQRRLIDKHLTAHSTRRKAIIELRYGLRDGKPLRDAEIAPIVGLTRGGVHANRKRTIEKLREQDLSDLCEVSAIAARIEQMSPGRKPRYASSGSQRCGSVA